MPSVIDSLILELQLDASKFNEGQKKAVDSLRGFQDNATKNLKPVQKGFDDLGETFRLMQGRLLAIGALIATGLGFNRLVQDVTKANTELGNLSRTLGMTAQDLSAWENVGQTVGASTGEIAGNMKALNAQIQEFHATGKSSLQALMGQVGIKPLQMNDTPDSVAKRLSEWYVKQPDKAFASHLLQSRGGLSQGMVNTLGLGPQELEKRLNFAKQLAPSDQDIKQFQKLTEAFGELQAVLGALERDAVLPLTNALTKVLHMITGWLTKVHLAGDNPAEAAGEGAAKMGYPELAPNKSKPSIFSRSWNWMRGRGFGGGPSPPEGTAPSSGSSPSTGSAPSPNESVQNRFGDWNRAPGNASAPVPSGETRSGSVPSTSGVARAVGSVIGMRSAEGSTGPSGGGPAPSQSGRPSYMHGTGWLQGYGEFHWGSGGAGRGSIPYGDYPITPGTIGAWGQAHGAVGLNNNRIWDSKLGSYRNGIELHASSSTDLDRLYTEGCFAVPAQEWPSFKRHLLGEIAKNGPMTLHVGAGGHASISHTSALSLPRGNKNIVDLASARRRLENMGVTNHTNTNNSNTATTHIGSMNVSVPPGANPSQYAHGISQKLEQYNNVAHSITGLN